MCNNVLFELYRAGSRHTALDDEAEEPEDVQAVSAEWTLMRAEERVRVRDALAGLPDKDKELLRLLFFEERDKDEVCRQMNVDRNYLRVLLHRAKLRFRERFGDQD